LLDQQCKGEKNHLIFWKLSPYTG